MLFGALEAGGTKMVMAIGTERGEILEQTSIPTRKPSVTIPEIIEYFKSKDIIAIGIGSFGPIDLDRTSKTYGYITSTPKLDWVNYNIVGTIRNALNIPVGFDTDVNAAALGEASWGSLAEVPSGIYITVGTGIGVGAYVNEGLLHGMLHPEAGHVLISRHPDDSFDGVCPYHSNCLEGFASGPSIVKRYGKKADELEVGSKALEIEAYYLAQGIVNYILTLSPHRIVLGGGVMNREDLLPLIRKQVVQLMNGYIRTDRLNDIDKYIVPASLGGNQGILGCIKLAVLENSHYHLDPRPI